MLRFFLIPSIQLVRYFFFGGFNAAAFIFNYCFWKKILAAKQTRHLFFANIESPSLYTYKKSTNYMFVLVGIKEKKFYAMKSNDT